MPRLLALFALLVLVAPSARGQQSGLAFLRMGNDAAALGMGDAYVALSTDAFATTWNPAGLAAAGANQVAVSHHRWVAGVRTVAGASRFRAGRTGGLGLHFTAFDAGELEQRSGAGPAEGTFSVQYAAAGLAYGRRLGPVRAGAGVKFISERIFDERAGGYAFDAGLQAGLWDDAVQLGAAVQNVGAMTELDADATPLPSLVRLGAAATPLRLRSADDDGAVLELLVTGGVTRHLEDERTQLHAGLAATLLDLLVLRGGYVTDDALRSWSAGAGLAWSGLAFDYALVPFDDGFDGPGHILTLVYSW